MTALSLNGFLSWVDQVAALDWPIDLETFSGRAAAASLGWNRDGFPWRFAGGPTGPSTVVALPDSSGVVTVLSCTLAKADSADEPLRDCFLRYEEVGTRAWGAPFSAWRWRIPSHGSIPPGPSWRSSWAATWS